jgi:DNA topoisomerase-1
MKVVVVESPTKTKTIGKYLGPDYKIVASMGHVRDLPSKDGSVDPEHHFAMKWAMDARGEKQMKDIIAAVKKADELLLATDPDREGEAISWHVLDILKERKALSPNIPVRRVVFYEITETAVKEAIENPRDLDEDLINAYMARRALDYLVGFNISPILWRKLPGSRSAGRVQSVALRLITEREDEIDAFNPQEYWSVTAKGQGDAKKKFDVRLINLKSEKLDKFSLNNEKAATEATKIIEAGRFSITKIEKKQVKRNPAPPFTTSTLQQEASRKLGFGASRTMRIAQQLYEGINIGSETVGLITYMRTDSINLSNEARIGTRQFIEKEYGKNYLPEEPRFYKGKSKNAQEAHEAIRPTDVGRRPNTIQSYLDKDQFRLYELIWKRMVACQMSNALLDQVVVDIADQNHQTILRANGSTIAFDGFFRVYREGRDEEDGHDEDDDRILPPLKEGEKIAVSDVSPNQHFTQPPPRYSEASLVKKLEELGIGRPSTYASIIQTLQARDYVTLEKKQFRPKDRGRIVTAFLLNYFNKYIQYDFTADLEDKLDDISDGRIEWEQVLGDFWKSFQEAVKNAESLTITDVIRQLNIDLAHMLFPPQEGVDDPRKCPDCADGRLSLKLGKYGGFVGCSHYPECKFTRKLGTHSDSEEESDAEKVAVFEPRELGEDPKSGDTVTLRKGPYGFYYQWGEPKGKIKPKRASLPKGTPTENASLEQALDLGALPRTVGIHPETGEEISAGIGRFGPFIRHEKTFVSLKKAEGDDPLTVDLARALELLANAPAKKKEATTKVKKKPKKK